MLLFTGFPSKLENDGAGRRKPPEGAGTPRRHSAFGGYDWGDEKNDGGPYTETGKRV